MTEKQITESEYGEYVKTSGMEDRDRLATLGITVVPDPAPPLPTEPGYYLDTSGELWERVANPAHWPWGHRGDWYKSSQRTVVDSAPFERLETVAEGDARVLAILTKYSRLPPFEWIERALREAREADAS